MITSANSIKFILGLPVGLPLKGGFIMGKIFSRPLSTEQLEKLDAKTKPSAEDILKAQDDLFMFLLERVAALEANQQGGDSYD